MQIPDPCVLKCSLCNKEYFDSTTWVITCVNNRIYFLDLNPREMSTEEMYRIL